jgi:hypothetical protein
LILTVGGRYLTPLLEKGLKEPLQYEDVGQPRDFDKASAVYERFQRAWQRELTKKNPSVMNAQFGAAGYGTFPTPCSCTSSLPSCSSFR